MQTDETPAEAKIVELPFPGRRSVPPWGNDRLRSLSKASYGEMKSFLVKRRRSDQGMVVFKDIDRFITTDDNAEASWNALIQLSQRTTPASHHQWDADYWTNPAERKDVAFVVIGENTLIAKGALKTAAARLALHRYQADTLYGVRVSRWVIDWEMYDLWKMLNRLSTERGLQYTLQPVRKPVHEEDQGSWHLEQYFLALSRQDTQTGRADVLNLKETKDWLAELQRPAAPQVQVPNLLSLGRRLAAMRL